MLAYYYSELLGNYQADSSHDFSIYMYAKTIHNYRQRPHKTKTAIFVDKPAALR